MIVTDFQKTKNEFINGTVDDKINIYVNAEGLNSEQYRELLKLFPLDQLDKLEKALG